MPSIFLYFIKVSVSLTAVYLLYRLLLRHLTFYQWNRWYLFGYSLISFAIPFVNIAPALPVPTNTQIVFVHYVPNIENIENKVLPIIKNQHYIRKAPFDWWHLLTIIYILVACFFCLRLLLQFISLYRLKRSAALIYHHGGIQLFELGKAGAPFSFGRSIFLHQPQHPEGELQEIIRHEMVHVQQWHSVDVLFAEMLCAINWFNPFAWFIRYSIKQNLEYLADDKVLQQGTNKKQYQYLLLKTTGHYSIGITNTFNFRDLKNRIAMMNRAKSAKLNLCRFLCALPLCALLLLACRAKAKKQAATNQLHHKKNTIVYIGRLVLGKDSLPIKGVKFEIKTNDTLRATMQTDENGMALFEDDLARYHKQKVVYSISDSSEMYPLQTEELSEKDSVNFGDFQVLAQIPTEQGKTELLPFGVSIPLDSILIAQNKKAFILQSLQKQGKEQVQKYKTDKAVSDDFVKNGKHGEDIIQLYHGKLFSQDTNYGEWEIIGNPDSTSFFLDSDPSSYPTINSYFRLHMRIKPVDHFNLPPNKTSHRVTWQFFTYSFFKIAPPNKLLRHENIEVHNISEVKNIELKAPMMMNCFRTSYATGWEGFPQQNPDKVALLLKFKGPLAKYYDERLSEIWWAETKDYNIESSGPILHPAFPKSLVP